MPGNTTSLYSSTGSSATVSGTNTSGLYGGTGSYVVGTTAYGNVNVAAFLQSYTGNLQAGNATILGNLAAGGVLTDNYYYANGAPISFAGTYGNANVANFLPTYTGNLQAGNLEVINDGNINNDLYVGGTIYGTFSGNIAGNLVVPGNNTDVIFNNAGNAGASSDFTFNDATNVMTVNGTANVNTLNATGNITGSYFIGNGSQLTGLPASYSNANVATFLANFGSNVISTTGNITGGNITGSYFIGNGSQLTGLPASYNDANVTSLLAAFGSNVISTTGNITGGNIIGNGQFLTNLPAANVTGTVANATYALNANAATFAGTVTTNAQPNITSVGNLTSLTVTGNLSGDNLILTGNIFYGNSPEPIGLGRVNPYTDYVYNNSSANLVFSIPSAGTWLIDFTVTAEIDHSSAADDVLSMGLFDSTNTQIGNAFTVIAAYTTAVGQIASSGSGQYIVTTTGPTTYYGNAVVNDSVTATTAFGSLVQLDAPVVMESISYTGNLNFAGNITANAGNITASSFLVGNNASVNNAITAQTITATGNVTGQYIIGDGSLLTNINAGNITGAYGNANVSNFLSTGFGSNTITTTGNITANTFVGQLNGNVIEPLQFGIEAIGNPTNVTTVYGNGVGIQSYTDQDISILSTTTNSHINMATFGSGVASDINIGAFGGATANVRIRSANLNAEQNISATGNVTAAQFNGNLQGKVLDSSQTGIQIIGNNSSATSTAIYGNGISILPLIGSDMFVLATGANTDIVIGGSGASANGALYLGQSPLSSSPMPTVLSSTDTYVQGNLRNNLGNIAIIDNVDVTGAVSATGNITGSYILGNGSQLTGLPATYGNANVSNFLANGFGSNTITTTGNITGSYFIGNGSQLTGIATSSYGNANVSNFLSTGFGSNTITTTGNITAGYFLGNGSQLTGITATANLAGNMSGNISGVNLYNITGLTSLSATSVATDTISSPSGDFVTIEGVIATNGGQMSGNLVFNNQQGVILREQTSSGTNYVQLKSYPSLSTDTIYLLPSDGSNGQVLTTSGTGNLSWTTVSSGSSSNSFSTIAANGTNIVATSSTDTLTLTAGTNITITGNAATDTITISAAGGGGSLSGNLAGNIFANGFAFTSESNGNVIITANGTGQLQTSKQKMATFAETVYAMGNVTGNLAANIDINNGSIQTMTLTGNITANSIQNMAAGQSITMIMTQDATGSRTLSSTMKWSGGYKTLTTTASATDIATIFYDGTTYYASLSRGYA